MRYKVHSEYGWPTDREKILLRALLCDGDKAIEAWEKWKNNLTGTTFDKSVSSVLPYLYFKLKQQQITIDDSLSGILHQRYTKALQKNQTSRRTLLKVVALLDTHGIDCMIPKGIPLLLFYYPDLGARTMSDIDLLIHYKDLPAAISILQEHNWKTKQALLPLSLTPFYHAIDFQHEQHTSVDLHWYVFKVGSPREAETRFWQHAVTKRIDKTLIKIPDVTDLLIQLCYHARKMDRLAKCRWVIDTSLFIEAEKNTINWPVLCERIQQARLVLPVRDTLTYLDQESCKALPESVIDELWRLPASKADKRSYFEIMRENTEKRGLSELIKSQWRRYRRGCQARGLSCNLIGFIRYYSQYAKWFWQASSLWQLPWIAVTRLAKRFRRPA